ncbi:hypothetical protein N8I77_005460 [Diaporthe amygdali]|uniref:Uncharacterized protein n=1 Tax=Phomopsis amygdali TaxID=1214568 RepID=A0AAD9W3E6_PHOAM|nr:hypothetical protein N8I77_005460 [Diaporthe amygdali]
MLDRQREDDTEARLQASVEEHEMRKKALADMEPLEPNTLWVPLEQGVAIIRGSLLLGLANFFRDCEITVHKLNQPNAEQTLTSKGGTLIRASKRLESLTQKSAQLRVHIEKFKKPPDTEDLKDPAQAALRDMQGLQANHLCMLILFFGSTGERKSREIDSTCSYWIHCAEGLEHGDIDRLGQEPFSMVRLSKLPGPDIFEIMIRLGIKPGKDAAKSFRDRFKSNVVEWEVLPHSFKDFRLAEWSAPTADADSEVSELTDLSDQFPEEDGVEDDEPEVSAGPWTRRRRSKGGKEKPGASSSG